MPEINPESLQTARVFAEIGMYLVGAVVIPLVGVFLKKEKDWDDVKDVLKDSLNEVYEDCKDGDVKDEKEALEKVVDLVKEGYRGSLPKRLVKKVRNRARGRVQAILKKVGKK